jgi:hypothetical protein
VRLVFVALSLFAMGVGAVLIWLIIAADVRGTSNESFTAKCVAGAMMLWLIAIVGTVAAAIRRESRTHVLACCVLLILQLIGIFLATTSN